MRNASVKGRDNFWSLGLTMCTRNDVKEGAMMRRFVDSDPFPAITVLGDFLGRSRGRVAGHSARSAIVQPCSGAAFAFSSGDVVVST